MNIQQARQQIIALRQQGKKYAVLDVGWRYLAAVPHDTEIAELVLGGLLDVGLGGLVRELLQLRTDFDQQMAKKWQAAADAVPVGRVPWAELADTYQANLALLIAHHPQMAKQEQALDHSLRGLHLALDPHEPTASHCRPLFTALGFRHTLRADSRMGSQCTGQARRAGGEWRFV